MQKLRAGKVVLLPGAGDGAQQQSGGQQASGKKDDDVVDADFEEVK